jgi:hypothetical protein
MTPPLASATPGVGSLRLGRRSGSGRRDGGNARLVFILGRAIIIAMELNAAVYDRYGNLSLPMLRIIDCYSARIRRLFRLPSAVVNGPNVRSSAT